MKSLLFSIFSKLSNNYVSKITKEREDINDSNSSLDDFIVESILEPIAPVESMYYSKTTNGGILMNNREGLKYYQLPIGDGNGKRSAKGKTPKAKAKVIGVDLTEGFSTYKRPTNEDVYSLNELFLVIDRQEEEVEKGSIVSLRRNLLLLMLIPLNVSKEYTFNVIPCGGYFIVDFDFDADLAGAVDNLTLSEADPSSRLHDMLCFTGLKFEEVVTNSGGGDSSFHTVTKHAVKKNPVQIIAEIDASTKVSAPGLSSYVELKTHTSTSLLDYKLTKKLISTWCQTKLVNGNHVAIGFRKKVASTYTLAAVKSYRTNEIPNLIHSLGHPIHVNVEGKNVLVTCQMMLRWYQCIINWIKCEITSDEKNVLKLSYSNKELTLRAVDGLTSTKIIEEKIPKWFREKYPNTDSQVT